MLGDGALTFREFAMREPLPLATIHDAVLESWNELAAEEILPEDKDAEFDGP